MTTQELRRLGVLPYADEDRHTRTFALGGTIWTVTEEFGGVPRRRLRNTWEVTEGQDFDIIVNEEAIQRIQTEIDQDIIDHINNTVSPPIVEPVNEPVNDSIQPDPFEDDLFDDIHPNRYDNTSFAHRAWRSFIERFRA